MRRWWILARGCGERFVGTGNRDKGIKDKGQRDQRQGTEGPKTRDQDQDDV